MLEQPGPPLNQVAKGAVVGFVRASKLRQTISLTLWVIKHGLRYIQPEPHVHVGSDREVAGILVDTWGSFTDARVRDELDLRTRRSVFEDGIIGAIALDKGTLVFQSGVW